MCDAQDIKTGIDLDRMIDLGHRLEEMMGHTGSSTVLRAGKNSGILLRMPSAQGLNPHLSDTQ